jgi:hypothetical protein
MTPTPATEFFAALQDLLLGADAHPQPAPVAAPQRACRGCGGGGELPDGGACMWCSEGDQCHGEELPGNVEDY